MKAQAFSKLAQTAADSGIAYAKACLKGNGGVPLWTDAKPLRPNTNCAGTAISGQSAFVLSTPDRRTSFEVGAYDGSRGMAAKGSVDLLRKSTGTVWRSFAVTQSEVLTEPTVITNLSTNPRALNGVVGWYSNNSAVYPVTKVSISGHPTGITTGIQSQLASGQSTPALMSTYNIDGMGNTSISRMIGAWAYVNAPGYKAFIRMPSGSHNEIELGANTWTFIQSAGSVTGWAVLDIQKVVGNAGSSDIAYATGSMSVIGWGSYEFADGASPGWAWNGAANSSTSSGPPLINNLNINPRAEIGTSGWSSNNGAVYPATKGVAISGHPRGVTTAVRSQIATGAITPTVLSLYNIDALGNTSISRMLGVWVYVNVSGYYSYIYPSSGVATETPLTANTWTFICSARPVVGWGSVAIVKISGNAAPTDYAYATAGISVGGNKCYQFDDGNSPGWVWNGTPRASTSTGLKP